MFTVHFIEKTCVKQSIWLECLHIRVCVLQLQYTLFDWKEQKTENMKHSFLAIMLYYPTDALLSDCYNWIIWLLIATNVNIVSILPMNWSIIVSLWGDIFDGLFVIGISDFKSLRLTSWNASFNERPIFKRKILATIRKSLFQKTESCQKPLNVKVKVEFELIFFFFEFLTEFFFSIIKKNYEFKSGRPFSGKNYSLFLSQFSSLWFLSHEIKYLFQLDFLPSDKFFFSRIHSYNRCSYVKRKKNVRTSFKIISSKCQNRYLFDKHIPSETN